ncbi:uncharacterized protein DFL_005543 [Arthrobotrys flagrans]|uniref:Ras-GAP domain-containing protein n=1 Tax=Arthrobotrys flagrans TaxID=97331 RepID=A0A436ZYE2_ARTFL|nr:hypothetical protein DFL_005543 [Arthrobotrys flagrans]
MSMNSLAQFRDMTIRPVPQGTSDDEIKKDAHPRSALSTPPRTPNNDVYKPEPRMNQFPISTRSATFAPTSHPQPLSNEKTIEYRTRARAIPHSPSSSTDETDVTAIASAAPMNEISLNTSLQALRGRPYAPGTSPNHSVPSSPVPQSAPPLTGSSAQISTTIYASNGTPQRAATPKANNNAKLLKQKPVKKEGSNGALHSIKTSESISNLKTAQGGDASKVLNLMKELRGKMEGNLEYRIGDGMTWAKGFCTIQEETGRLTHVKDDKTKVTVIGDLRGCQIRTNGTKSDDHEGIIEVSTFSSRQDIKLRPLNAYQYDCWLAALLCWQPIRPAGPNNKKIKTQPVRLATDRKVDRRRNSDATVLKDAAIIKVGKMMLWDRSGQGNNAQSAATSKDKSSKSNKAVGPTWRRISCILQENGEFKLYNETDVALLNVVTLSSLSRSSIQYLDPSVLGMEYCIGIYPHASTNTRFQAGTPPIYLALDTKILFEVWFVLLRAYTVPELYGPAGVTGLSASTAASPHTPSVAPNFDFGASSLIDAFRVPRLFSMKIVEAKLPNLPHQPDEYRHQFSEKKDTEFFFELFIDGDIRARSPPRVKGASCMWMETFEFNELPSQLNVIEVVLKQRTVKHKRDRGPTSSNGPLSTYQIITGEAIGVITINLNDLQFDAETETWWPILPVSKAQEAPIGEVMLRMRKEELVVLMMEEYKPLLELISNFSNGLTILISQIVNTDLRRLAHTLLKIFQVSGKSVDWLMALAEADVSGIYKDGGLKALPNTGSSTDVDVQLNQANPDPSVKSDSTKRAQMEANILFRGNSLLTKAVEAHMARYAKEYMDETIGGHVKRIAEEDLYCEVDPMKCKNQDEIKQNWKTLNSLVRNLWQSICYSGHKCPLEVKKVLYHIRLCVEEKFGGIISGPTYSSVSGFLFLRFFCPAIMNPKMFGLLKDHPGTRAQRTLTLVAKSLQGLANMTTFGVKEPWFEPMNEFLVEHNGEFKKYIDSVSASPPEVVTSFQVPPSYATPITIQARLQQGSKEGFPSLPFLIDQPRAIGRLVQMWLKWHELQEAKGGSINHPKVAGNTDVLKFHEICLHLKERMATCVERAENAERPSSSLSGRWEAVVESVAGSSGISAVWESGSKEPIIGAGYTISSTPTPTTPGPKQRNTSPGGGANYTRAVSATNYKNGNAPQTSGLYEDDNDLGNIAQLGKTKIVDFVGGIKKKVQGAKEAH